MLANTLTKVFWHWVLNMYAGHYANGVGMNPLTC